MKFIALSFLVTACASLAQAELKYITYNIESGEVRELTSAPTDIATNEGYRNGSTILFVQDPSVSEDYIGVFEVTNAQAKALGWTNSVGNFASRTAEVDEHGDLTEGAAIAYAASTSGKPSFSLDLHPLLRLPTKEEWLAYAGKIEDEDLSGKDVLTGDDLSLAIGYNLKNGFYFNSTGALYEPHPSELDPTAWPGFSNPKAWPWLGTASAKHGAYDMYGNVAEITRGGVYMGGCASQTYSTSLTAENLELSNTVSSSDYYLGARLIYTPKENATFTVTVQLNGKTQATSTEKVDALVSFEIPDPADGTGLYAVEVSSTSTAFSSEDLTHANGETSFTMPVGDVTINYIYKSFVTITVEGGTSSDSTCIIGDSVEITPTLPTPYSVFKTWDYDASLVADDEASMVTEDPVTHALTFTPTDALTSGSVVTFTASYDTCPRVLVYGGTVEVTNGEALGEGYYTEGSTLTLTAPVVNGYTVKWSSTVGTGEGQVSGSSPENPRTISNLLLNAVETYTAVYEATTADGIEQTLPTFGETLPFGYTTADASVTLAGNKYTFDALTAAEQVVLNLEEKTIDFETEVSSTLLTDGKHLALLRVEPKLLDPAVKVGDEEKHLDTMRVPFYYLTVNQPKNIAETYHVLEPYYLAVTELTEAQRKWIDETTVATNVPHLAVSSVTTQAAAKGVVSTLSERFDSAFTAELPSQAQCEAAALVGYTAEHQQALLNYLANPLNVDHRGTFLQDVIAYNGTNSAFQVAAPNTIANAGVNRGGFYGLLGNYAEWTSSSESQAYSGGCNELSASSTMELLMKMLEALYEYSPNYYHTCRPMIPSPYPGVTVTLKIGEDEKTVTVPKGEIPLGSPVVAGKAFKGWRVNDATTIAEGTTFSVEADTTFTAVFDDVALIAITYEGCTGAASLPAGGQTLLYPTRAAEVVAWKVVVNGEERTDCMNDALLTIPTDATSVSVTAIYKASGYLLRLK